MKQFPLLSLDSRLAPYGLCVAIESDGKERFYWFDDGESAVARIDEETVAALVEEQTR